MELHEEREEEEEIFLLLYDTVSGMEVTSIHGQISCENDNGFRVDEDSESCGYGLY
jgi:hypothetical protein